MLGVVELLRIAKQATEGKFVAADDGRPARLRPIDVAVPEAARGLSYDLKKYTQKFRPICDDSGRNCSWQYPLKNEVSGEQALRCCQGPCRTPMPILRCLGFVSLKLLFVFTVRIHLHFS